MASDKEKELMIRINSDLKNFESGMKKIESQTEALTENLSKIAKISSVAFVGITAAIGYSVAKFAEADKASRQLSQSLQEQGIYSDELATKYDKMADALENRTGQDADAIKSGMALAQGYLGEIQITEDLSRAVTDLAAAKGIDLAQAFDIVGKTIGTSTNALGKYGVEIREGSTRAEKMSQAIEGLNARFAGQAEAVNPAALGMGRLHTQFDNFLESIGERFAPMVGRITNGIADLFEMISKSPVLTTLIGGFLEFAAIATGIISVVSGAGLAFVSLKKSMLIPQIGIQALGLSVKALVGATGIGLLIIAIAQLVLNWDSAVRVFKTITTNFTSWFSQAMSAVGEIISGMTNGFDLGLIKSGMNNLKNVIAKSWDDIGNSLKPLTPEMDQNQAAADAARKRQAIEREYERRATETLAAEQQLRVMKAQEASDAMIQLKSQEAELLKQLEDKKNADIESSLYGQLERVRARQAEQAAIDTEQRQIYRDQILSENEEFNQLTAEQQQSFIDQRLAAQAASITTEAQARQQIADEEIKKDIERHNLRVVEEQKFGKSIAAARAFFRTEEVQQTKSFFGDMAQLTQTNNRQLFELGKFAAMANAAINVAESVTKSMTTYPYPFNLAAAAATAAAGVAQISTIKSQTLGMANGGLVTGGIPGVDSVPIVAQQNELVSPARSFDQVVEGVARQKGFVKGDENSGVISAIQELGSAILSRPQNVFHGDVLADESFIDSLIRKISDRVEYGNGRLVASEVL